MLKSSNAKKSAPKKGRKKRIIIIGVSAVLAAIIIFAAVFGIILGVQSRRAVISCDGVTMDEGTTAFFMSYYKSRFLSSLTGSGVNAYDTEDFWNREYYSGITYGEHYEKSARKYIGEICAAAALFDELTKLSKADKERIDTVISEVLDYKADGSRAKFDEQTAEFGFDYSDFEKGAKLLYKAQAVRAYAFGKDGERLESLSAEYRTYIEEYYALYSRVKLLFIRTEDRFLLDADGKRVPDADGNDTLVDLSDEQRAQRQQTIAKIRGAIAAAESGADGAMNPIMFDTLLSECGEGDADMNESGYYFFDQSDYTAAFSEEFADIVKKSYMMKVGEYAELPTEFGVCFIYKCENKAGAYKNTAPDGCFSDFYSDAADYIFAKSVEEIRAHSRINEERFAALDILKIPANSSFVPKF